MNIHYKNSIQTQIRRLESNIIHINKQMDALKFKKEQIKSKIKGLKKKV